MNAAVVLRRCLSCLTLILIATTLSTLFVNCSDPKKFNAKADAGSPALSGGTGLDGKPFYSFGMCPDGRVDVESAIEFYAKGSAARKTRENCRDLAAPAPVDVSRIDFAWKDDAVLRFAGKIFDRHTSGKQRITVEFVRSSLNGPQVEALIWQFAGEAGTLYGRVTERGGLTSGALKVEIPLSTRPTRYLTASDQESRFDLTIADDGAAGITYAIDGGPEIPVGGLDRATQVSPAQPKSALHYASGNDLVSSGGAMGFNLADVSSVAQLDALPASAKALVWLGLCDGVDAAFISKVTPFLGHPKVYGFHLMSDPDPTGTVSTVCPAANLKAESDWIHAQMPGAKTYIVLMAFNSIAEPTYLDTYNTANSGVDLFGLNPYPCRSELSGCDFGYIGKAVLAAQAAGVPRSAMVPVYQAAGGFADDAGGTHLVPTPAQENQLLSTWAAWLPTPAFDHVYAWRTTPGVTTLEDSPALQPIFAGHNAP